MAYATVEEISQYLDQLQSTPENIDLLERILDRASSIIDEALGFSFAGYTTGTRLVSSYGTPYLTLPPHEQGSVTAVTYGTTPATVTVTDYAEQPDGSLLLTTTADYANAYPYRHNFPNWPYSLYTVTADWGYGVVPASVVEVCLELAVNIWRSRDKGLWTDVIGADGGGGIRFIGGLTNQQRAILNAVKRRFAPQPVVA
jgi:hypothetical protein